MHVEGKPKHWELSESLKQHFGANNPPERKNLEFLIGLRNKIEHQASAGPWTQASMESARLLFSTSKRCSLPSSVLATLFPTNLPSLFSSRR